MYIRNLAVEGIGRFATSARVDGFDQGVNVLAAGNEIGKSTLFKAIRTCLFCRHDSKTQDIRDLASDGSLLPAAVQLSFAQNGRTYGIRKSFLRSPCALLTEDGREIARGKQADEAVWDVLGLRPGSGRTLDEGAFGLLWVGQGCRSRHPCPAPARPRCSTPRSNRKSVPWSGANAHAKCLKPSMASCSAISPALNSTPSPKDRWRVRWPRRSAGGRQKPSIRRKSRRSMPSSWSFCSTGAATAS